MRENHLVLARKYRPQTFSELIGQEIMVKILTNSFKSGKISHSFILTGLRGIGKTTTARIIAKGLNCIGIDSKGNISTEPCGNCSFCKEITEGRSVDVLEVDAASRTGVNDIRELIDGVNYNPASARYKIYIIDEVHMLSTSAFNALLKTLEEPPKHVKFIFATTEISKIPGTILSRCQRFDLRRISNFEMLNYLKNIAQKENYRISEDGLGLIVRASEGSMRDALSILEQAISGNQHLVSLTEVRDILGLNDRLKIIRLFEKIVMGDTQTSLKIIDEIYWDGGDPNSIIKELSEIAHFLTLLKISPELIKEYFYSEEEIKIFEKLTANLSIRVLSRLWQLLIKVIDEMTVSPDNLIALEMGIIRITHISDLPTPEEMISKIEKLQFDKDENNHSDLLKNVDIEKNLNDRDQNNFKMENKVSDEDLFSFDKILELLKKNDKRHFLLEIENNLTFNRMEGEKIICSFDSNLNKEILNEVENIFFEEYNKKIKFTEDKVIEDKVIEDKDIEGKFSNEKKMINEKLFDEIKTIFPGSKIEN